jgi:hypothetical protein
VMSGLLLGMFLSVVVVVVVVVTAKISSFVIQNVRMVLH